MSKWLLVVMLAILSSDSALAGEGGGLFGFRKKQSERREVRQARPEDYGRLRVWDYHRPQPRLLRVIPHTSERPWGGLRWRGLSYHRNPLASYRDYDDGFYGGPKWVEEVEVLHRNRQGQPVVWRWVWRQAQ